MAPHAQGWRCVPVLSVVPQSSHQPSESSRGSPAGTYGGGQKVVKNVVIALHSFPLYWQGHHSVARCTAVPQTFSAETSKGLQIHCHSDPKVTELGLPAGWHLPSESTNHRHLVPPNSPWWSLADLLPGLETSSLQSLKATYLPHTPRISISEALPMRGNLAVVTPGRFS